MKQWRQGSKWEKPSQIKQVHSGHTPSQRLSCQLLAAILKVSFNVLICSKEEQMKDLIIKLCRWY